MPGVGGENFPGRIRNTPDADADQADKVGLIRKIKRIVTFGRIVASGGLAGGGSLGEDDIIIRLPALVTATTIPLAKITALGADGSITVDQYGRITAYTAPT